MGLFDSFMDGVNNKMESTIENVRKRYREIARNSSDYKLLEIRDNCIDKGNQVGLEVVEEELDKRGISY